MKSALHAVNEGHPVALEGLGELLGRADHHGRALVVRVEVVLYQLELSEQRIEIGPLGLRGVLLLELELVEERVEHGEHDGHAPLA